MLVSKCHIYQQTMLDTSSRRSRTASSSCTASSRLTTLRNSSTSRRSCKQTNKKTAKEVNSLSLLLRKTCSTKYQYSSLL